MFVSYNAIYELLSSYYAPKSVKGFIEDCQRSFEESKGVALDIEDYRFLSVMSENLDTYENMYSLFWDYKSRLPLIIEKKQDLNVWGLAKLFHSTAGKIPVQRFEDLIYAYSEYAKVDPNPEIAKFKEAINAIRVQYRIAFEKIQRNEVCPCGSEKKYKNCHGK